MPWKVFCFWPRPCRRLRSRWRRLCFTPLLWTHQKTDYFSEVVKYLLSSQHKTARTHRGRQFDEHADTMSRNKTEKHSISRSAHKCFLHLSFSFAVSHMCTVIHTLFLFLLFISADRSSKTPESIKKKKSNTCLEPTVELMTAGVRPRGCNRSGRANVELTGKKKSSRLQTSKYKVSEKKLQIKFTLSYQHINTKSMRCTKPNTHWCIVNNETIAVFQITYFHSCTSA